MTALDFNYEGKQYRIELCGNELLFYRITHNYDPFDKFGEVSDHYTTLPTKDVKNIYGLMQTLAGACATLIHTASLGYYYFNVSDNRLQYLYERFCKLLPGYRYVCEGDHFYLFKQCAFPLLLVHAYV